MLFRYNRHSMCRFIQPTLCCIDFGKIDSVFLPQFAYIYETDEAQCDAAPP